MALDLVSLVNHLAPSKLFGKSVLVQLHLSIISLSEVSVQTLDIIRVISLLSCIICIHTDEAGEELYAHGDFRQPRHTDIQCRFPPRVWYNALSLQLWSHQKLSLKCNWMAIIFQRNVQSSGSRRKYCCCLLYVLLQLKNKKPSPHLFASR